MFGWFGEQDLVSEAESDWLFDAFAWSLRNFDAQVFFQESRLVVPSNEHFPGREDSVQGMAQLIFDHVKGYAGMAHWPFELVDGSTCAIGAPVPVQIQGPLRAVGGLAAVPATAGSGLPVAYDPQLLGNPEALIASYAHTLAHHLGQMAKEPPPGGAENWPQVTEVLAVFLGFGLMFANSAFEVAVRSCGSCGGPRAQRRSYLTEAQSTYALAIFCALKGIPNADVLRHLKKSLRPFYRKCAREVAGRPERLQLMRSSAAAPAAAPILETGETRS